MDQRNIRLLVSVISVWGSGLLWYFSCGLDGHFWWMMWLAPVPVLWAAIHATARAAWWLSFLAYAIGRACWIPYLYSVVPVSLVILFSILLPVLFACLVWVFRKMLIRQLYWQAPLVLATLFCSQEFLLALFSRDGTAASLAYTQMNALPVIQVAAWTGFAGITFLLVFIPAAIVTALMAWPRRVAKRITVAAVLLVILCIGGGLRRLRSPQAAGSLRIGMACLNETAYWNKSLSSEARDREMLTWYTEAIGRLADSGAAAVLLPEKILEVGDPGILKAITRAAISHRVGVIVGLTFSASRGKGNQALVIDGSGELLASYQKVNLFGGEQYEGFVPGRKRADFFLDGIHTGVVVCKDMDFPAFIRSYPVRLMYVPAWDFERDDWLHARMAVLRGVENGFTIVRNARLGLLTVSDPFGRILAEHSAGRNDQVCIIAPVPVYSISTFYHRFGEWFGICCLLFSGYGILLLWKYR